MLDKLPEWIDPISSVNHNKRFTDRVNQSRFTRLNEVVESPDGEVAVQLDFFFDKALKLPAFVMQIDTSLKLQCQRSLNVFDYPVHSEIKGVLAESLALTEDMPADVEVYQLSEEKISPYEWIEEELLLSVPLAPVDEQSAAPEFSGSAELDENVNDKADAAEEQAERPNPFAVLQGLKKN